MPLYEYRCDLCGAAVAIERLYTEALPETLGEHYFEAGKCGGLLRRVYGPFTIRVR